MIFSRDETLARFFPEKRKSFSSTSRWLGDSLLPRPRGGGGGGQRIQRLGGSSLRSRRRRPSRPSLPSGVEKEKTSCLHPGTLLISLIPSRRRIELELGAIIQGEVRQARLTTKSFLSS